MHLSRYFAGWPAENVSAALVGTVEASFGDPGRVFELMSVTKLLSAYSVLMAVEEGAFSLDDACGPPGSTVRHLLSHASGVAFDAREQRKPAGQRRIYSSAGFEILADFLAERTGMTLGQYAKLGVFDPLGMDTVEIYGSAGHGGRASLSDMRSFAAELAAPTLLARETLNDAFSNQFGDIMGIVPGYGMHKPCPWGLGFEIKGEKTPHWLGDNMPADTVGHFGMSGTYLWVVPAWSNSPHAGTAMVVLTDRDFGDWAKPLWQETNAALFNEL
ncbi:serine hydrolase domain-containing protein [Corynebacterium liangguodongii]|uniref:Serine hydrolase n=1 Tax=Corynebacterium liangguodongii TaxID=2079535 RepID=A0A2S0WFD4_9CORY|nr:serine hydrolase domain-containing protein [Corynebacterium liangguodongii]AWB84434.1 serine hydrolase [Corynebacterium liangguodongii]PWB99923.1 serine hydrolase [Corynebacterium liangguodongii]